MQWTKNRAVYYSSVKLNVSCFVFYYYCYLTSGTLRAALRWTYPARYCRLARPSQTNHITAHLYLTPQRALTWTNPTLMTFMRSRGPSMRADVSAGSHNLQSLDMLCYKTKNIFLWVNTLQLLKTLSCHSSGSYLTFDPVASDMQDNPRLNLGQELY